MMRAKFFLKSLLVFCLFFVAGLVNAGPASAAARLYFDPANASPVKDANFQIDVKIDVGTTSIFGADAIINYPASDLSVQSVSYGGFFSDNVSAVQDSGQIILRGSFFSSNTGSGSGAGTFASIVFKSNKDTGSGNITFTCTGSGNDTDIIDISGNNILSCSSINLSAITYTGTSTTPTPSPTSSGVAPTNACGGTCGSPYNCNTGLFCYNGFCRNPDCRDDLTCSCKATAAPAPTRRPTIRTTPKPTTTKGAASPTPFIATLTQYTPPPPFIPELIAEPVPEEETGKGLNARTAGIIVGAIALGIAGIVLLASKLKGKNPPKFTPPVGPGFGDAPPDAPTAPPPSF